jgi:hypothetical protein
VVGINSFHSRRGVTDDNAPTVSGEDNGQYTIEDNDDTPHMVFQFQNLLAERGMNSTDTTAGGYPASEMRKYLTTVENHEESGKFLAGLKNAGVPEETLWVPKRYVSARTVYNEPAAALIEDVLWLPTVREMFGIQFSSVAEETEGNQARLEYYDNDAKRTKYFFNGNIFIWWFYWLASQTTEDLYPQFFSKFYLADVPTGNFITAAPEKSFSIAPAFCVK